MVVVKVGANNRPEIRVTPMTQEIEDGSGILAAPAVDQDSKG